MVKALQNKKIVHFFHEGELWHFCQEIDYFQKGVFYLAHHANCPVYQLFTTLKQGAFLAKSFPQTGLKLKP
jgi:hypothetical protein